MARDGVSWRTAAHIAWRDLRPSPGRLILSIAGLAAGVAMMTALRAMTAEVARKMTGDARPWIAADVSVVTTEAPAGEWTPEAGVQFSGVTELLGMAAAMRAADPVAVWLKAVDPDKYPFYGRIDLLPPLSLSNALRARSVVVSADLLARLHVSIGDELLVNRVPFRIAATIVREPDRFAVTSPPFPRVILGKPDLARTGAGLRSGLVFYRLLFRLDPRADPASLRRRLERLYPEGEVTDYRNPAPESLFALESALIFLNLCAWMALALGSLGVTVTILLHIERRLDAIAVMKALGARSAQVMRIYLAQSAGLAVAGAIAGIACSPLVERAFLYLAARDLPVGLAPRWEWTAAGESLLLSVVCAAAFAMAPVLRVRSARPWAVLRRHTPAERRAGTWWHVVILAVLACAGGLAAATDSPLRVPGFFFMGLFGGILVLDFTSRGLVRAVSRLEPNLDRPGAHSGAMVLALAVGAFLTTAAVVGQKSLARTIVAALPVAGANLYLAGLTDAQRDAVLRFAGSLPGVRGPAAVAPLITLKLRKVEGGGTSRRNAAFDTTWFATCVDNDPRLQSASGSPEVLLAETNARRLGAGPGTILEFAAGSRILRARVAGTSPLNLVESHIFGLTFPCSAFAGLQRFHVAALTVAEGSLEAARRALGEKFPALVQVSRNEFETTIETMTQGALSLLAFIATLILLTAAVVSAVLIGASKRQRAREIAIWKALGAGRRKLARAHVIEFGGIGLMAGALGSVLGNGFAGLLLSAILRKPVVLFEIGAVMGATAGVAALGVAAGWIAIVPLLRQRPLAVLRDE